MSPTRSALGNSPAVLVVEDEALLLFSIAEDLRDAGFEVFEASNADEAIALLEEHPGIGVLFTDVDMPGSMDGLKLSMAVRERWPPVKLLVTSGHMNVRNARLPEGGRFMPKPYRPERVIASMRDMLAQPG